MRRPSHHLVLLTALCLLVLVPHVAPGAAHPFISASSVHSHPYQPEYAVDSRPDTRWASRVSTNRPEWLLVDLREEAAIGRVTIRWEHAYAVEYEVQTSLDGKQWRSMAAKTGGKGGTDELSWEPLPARYVRVWCTKPGPFPLFSIWELTFPEEGASAALRRMKRQAEKLRAAAEAERRQRLAETMEGLGIGEIVFAVRECGPDGHWYANFGYFAERASDKCYRAGGRLCKLHVATGEVTTLVDDPRGSVRDPVVHHDGIRVLFSWRRADEEVFHLYEIKADGTELRQLTDGVYDDIEPAYLPDGGIVFVSGRCKRWVNCWLTQVGVLYRCDADGSNIRQLSANVEHDNTPWVLPDGRIMYQRWEYVDRSQVHYHHLWTMNPDGTGQMVAFGNLHAGGVFIDAKPIPGTRDVLLIHSPGHGRREHAGHVAILRPDRGPDARDALRDISPDGYRDPYPLSTDTFLAATGNRLDLINREGEALDLYQLPSTFPQAQIHEPRPVVARPPARPIPPRVRLGKRTGALVLADVNAGRNMDGVQRGEIRKLLVLESLPKPINYTGGMEPMSYGGTFTLERILGTVPVEPDGSAYFELPANRALFFVALDGNESSVKRMQSFLTVMPGETTSCVGCHEPRTQAPRNGSPTGRLRAVGRPPSRVEPVPDIPDVFDYVRDVQPVLDRHCVRCHNPGTRKGGVLLTGDRGPMFSHSYFTLSARLQIADGRNRAKSNYPPRGIGDSASPLVEKLTAGHQDVKAPPADVRLVRYWINSGGAWLGTYAGLGTGMIGGYARNQIDRRDLKWPSVKAACEVLKQRCASCHDKQKALPQSPSDNMGMPPWAVSYGDPRLRFSRHILYNLTTPEKSGLLLAPLAQDAGGWGMPERDAQGKPTGKSTEVFADASDPGYQALLASIQDTKERLDEIKRFDMPGFTPRPEYVREMKRYGVLPEDLDMAKSTLDVYQTDREYWRSLWYTP